MPVPYVVLSPGPVTDTLGSDNGKDLITVTGRRTYPTEGHLDLTTINANGGPGDPLSLVGVLAAWRDRGRAVVPEETVYPKGETAEQVQQENAEEMTDSQQFATAAALRSLGVEVQRRVIVRSIAADAPSKDLLDAGDVLVSVDGRDVASPDDLRAGVSSHRPGEPLQLALLRGGRPLTQTVTTRAAPDGRTIIGIVPGEGFSFPFTVKISLDDVGGPSAGLMFALGIVDKLTPGPLNGGRFVAGTGTIDADGNVGAIGGIQQKMRGARGAGATVFIAPADNCPAVLGAVPDGLQVVKAATLAEARAALEGLAAGRMDLPACPR